MITFAIGIFKKHSAVKTFSIGGIHPEENKLAHQSKLEVLGIPKQAVLYASQHLGAPAVIQVQKGDTVKVGQLLAKGEAFVSANLHSPYSGTVSKVDVAADVSGIKKPAIYIDVEGDEWLEDIDRSEELKKEITLSSAEIIAKIKEKGIVGLGGACFPTHVKLSVPEGKKVEYLLINAAECEPYISIDNRILLERTEEFLTGTAVLRKALQLEDVYIGIEENKADAIARLKELLPEYPGVHVETLRKKYPQGAEKQLIKSVTRREVPSGRLPLDVGCIVCNVSTTLAVYEAVQKNKPLIGQYLTYSGKSVSQPRNFYVRYGTPVQDIIAAGNGLPEDTGKLVSGGPMMGKAMVNPNAYTTKGFSSLLVISEKEARRKPAVNCIRCGKCVEACPMGLEPYLLTAYAERKRWEDMEKHHIMDCMECGCCQYSCPSNRPLTDLVRLGKNRTGAMIRARQQQNK
ncbi:MAG: electron transport complex subunit RsxC [Bacteroidales bacterium]|nr:electron transport complex subunit RsxC [Bacteroidales bacterium]